MTSQALKEAAEICRQKAIECLKTQFNLPENDSAENVVNAVAAIINSAILNMTSVIQESQERNQLISQDKEEQSNENFSNS
jgi:hypothetical protein